MAEPQRVEDILHQVTPNQENLGTNGNNFDDIELTEEETKEALRLARQKKYYRLEDEQREKSRKEYIEWLTTPFTLAGLMQWCTNRFRSRFGKEFVIDVHNEHITRALLFYFAGDARFETYKINGKEMGWKLNKGIFMYGGVGTGKSTLMDFFRINKRQCYEMISCRRVADLYQEDGAVAAEEFSKPIANTYMDAYHFYQPYRGHCFDDLGTEDVKNSYGNKKNVLTDILLNRYDKRLEFPLKLTHVTSNLIDDELIAMYGERTFSRLREMFNLVKLEGVDRRKEL